MRLLAPKTLRISKAGNRPEECEDSFRILIPYATGEPRNDTSNARIALSDGASESAFAREWARILTNAFVANTPDLQPPPKPALATWLEPCREEWNRVVPWNRIPWHGEAKARAGALATLLGITIGTSRDSPGKLWWRAVAIGDSCFFLVRNGEMALSFPIGNSAHFDNSPSLICSKSGNNDGIWGEVCHLSGDCAPGDLIILASDALAQWLLVQEESGSKPWKELLGLHSRGQLGELIGDLRRERSIRNDDTTLIMVMVD